MYVNNTGSCILTFNKESLGLKLHTLGTKTDRKADISSICWSWSWWPNAGVVVTHATTLFSHLFSISTQKTPARLSLLSTCFCLLPHWLLTGHSRSLSLSLSPLSLYLSSCRLSSSTSLCWVIRRISFSVAIFGCNVPLQWPWGVFSTAKNAENKTCTKNQKSKWKHQKKSVDTDPVPEFIISQNPPQRCYFCSILRSHHNHFCSLAEPGFFLMNSGFWSPPLLPEPATE